MSDKKRMTLGTLLLGLMTVSTLSGCVIEPRDGDYDRDHHRWYHEHRWHECGDHDDEHCHWRGGER